MRINNRLEMIADPDGPVLLSVPRIGQQPLLRLQDQRLDHRDRIEGRPAALGAVAVAQPLDQPGPEEFEVHGRLEHLELRRQLLARKYRPETFADLAEKLRLALNLTRALGHIHERKVTHKDVSSGNILIADTSSPGSQDGVYLIDFALASTTGEDRPSRLAPDDSLVGTLAYVSPEQTGRMNLRVLELFSGIGGAATALEGAAEVVLAVDQDAFAFLPDDAAVIPQQ